MSELCRNLERFYNENLMCEDRKNKYMRIFLQFEKKIKEVHPDNTVKLYGSFENGFLSKYSDMDITVLCYLFPNRKSQNNLIPIYITLKETFKSIEFEMPLDIIKFSMTDGIRGDISINNNNGLNSTKLLKLFSGLHPSVSILGVLLKCMVKHFKIKDAADGYLSSYAYMIMLIHYLQNRDVLPALQELPGYQPCVSIQWLSINQPARKAVWKPKETGVSLGELWMGFFRYYLYEFDIKNKLISINQSRIISKLDKWRRYSPMSIEDPFQPYTNLASRVSEDRLERIKTSFKQALENEGNPFKWSCEFNETPNRGFIFGQPLIRNGTKRYSVNYSEFIQSMKRRKF